MKQLKTVICLHHGSPGSARDFFHLGLLLPDCHLEVYDRVEKNYTDEHKKALIQLGYSFGCVEALNTAVENENTRYVILIAPFLFPQKKPGVVMKSLLNISLFNKKVLPRIAKKSIHSMLVKSSYPETVPDHYKDDAKAYVDPRRLKHSIMEKDFAHHEIYHKFQKLEDRGVKVFIILGEQDLTSSREIQIDPLKRFKNITLQMIPKAGHALLWTHTDALARKIKEVMKDHQKNHAEEKLGYYHGVDERNNVASFLKAHLESFPNKKILSWVDPKEIEKLKNWQGELNLEIKHQSVTVAELDHLVGILCHEFKKIGIQNGDRVILFIPMSLYMYASMFALQKMGAIPTFLDSWARRDQMGVSAQVANPRAMISSDRAFGYLMAVDEIKNIPIKVVAGPVASDITYNAKLEELLAGKTKDPITPVEKEHTALITFTTGSSGTPKGADRSHRFLAAQHYALNRHLPYDQKDKDLPVFPIFSLNNLAAGVETIIPAIDVGAPTPHDGGLLFLQMKSIGVTCTTLSPSLFNALSSFCLKNNLKVDFLKRVVTGGAPISKDDVKRMREVAPNAEILVLYGSTEVEPMAHIEAHEMLAEVAESDPEIVEPGVNVGRLDSGLKVKFIKIDKEPVYVNSAKDWEKVEVPSATVGELIVAGEHVCEKYFNNEEAFFRAKIRDHDGIVWHRTGDLGFLDQNQNLWIVGRVHNAIRRGNDYFFPVKAEIILKRFPFVKKAAFLGMEDKKLGEKTFAVFSTTDFNLDLSAAKKEIRRVLEKNKFVVDEVIHVDDIPMDPRHHSKVEYGLLKKKITENV